MGEPPLVVPPRGRELLGNPPTSAAIGVTAVGFALLGGPAAAALAVIPALGLVLGGPVLAFIVGIIGLLGVGDVVGLAPIPSALVLASFPLAATYESHGPRPAGIYLASVAAAVGTFVVARATLDGLLAVAAVSIGGLAFVGYGIHRYELLTLGLIDE
jgi:hypothetical protein